MANQQPVDSPGDPRISWGYRLAAGLLSLVTLLFLFMFLGCFDVGFVHWGKDGCAVETSAEFGVLAFLAAFGLMTFPLWYVAVLGRSPLPRMVNEILTSPGPEAIDRLRNATTRRRAERDTT